MDQEKIQAIRSYLQKLFPSAEHEDMFDLDRMGHKFRIITENHVMLTLIRRKLIDCNDSEAIISILNRINISKLLKDNPTSTVIVNNPDYTPPISIIPRNQ